MPAQILEPKPVLDLTRSSDSGNAFAIIAAAQRAARAADWPKDRTTAVLHEMMDSDYENLLTVAQTHFDIVTR